MPREVYDFSNIPEVNEILGKLKSGVKEILDEQFIGMYIHGSLALGDFNPESSDIDFIVVTVGELQERTILGLRNFHTSLINSDFSWAKRLEGSFISQNTLKQKCPPESQRLYINGEKCCLEKYGSEWVLERYVLLNYGIVIEGPPIQTFISPINPGDIKDATLSILTDWWLPMLYDTTRLNSSEYQAYAVLTMCRILYTLKYESIVSKPMAATWVKKEFGHQWRELVEQAQSWREGKIMDSIDKTMNFIRFTQEYSKGVA